MKHPNQLYKQLQYWIVKSGWAPALLELTTIVGNNTLLGQLLLVSYCSRKPTGSVLWLSEHSVERRGCAHMMIGLLCGEWQKLPLKIQQLFILRNWYKGGYNSHMQNFFTSRANLGSCPSEFVIFLKHCLANHSAKPKRI